MSLPRSVHSSSKVAFFFLLISKVEPSMHRQKYRAVLVFFAARSWIEPGQCAAYGLFSFSVLSAATWHC